MRKFIIDTDTASDDAAAILLAVLSKEIDLLGVTVTAGNVGLEQAGNNALMTLEVCGSDAPVYLGAKRPLFRPRKETISVHGSDGMGDRGIIKPKGTPEEDRAVEFILDMANKYPGEVEIAVLGPATNIALAVLTDRDAMRKIKHIWTMGTPGFGIGNATPVSEFNVYMDAAAYAIMLDAGAPVTIIGFDMCEGDIRLDKDQLTQLENGNACGKFLNEATKELLEFNLKARGVHMVDLPDAVAMAVAVWPDFTTAKVTCRCHCCVDEGPTYGQVIFYKEGRTYEALPMVKDSHVAVITEVDVELFTERFMNMMTC